MTGAAGSRVSVVIPARNEEELLSAAILSVCRQSYPAALIECLVVDNGSTDGTAEVARRTGANAPVRVMVVSEPQPGVGRAKNRGAAHSTGDILIFLDADSSMSETLADEVVAAHGRGDMVGSIRVLSAGGGPADKAFFGLMELGKRWFGVRAQMLYCDAKHFKDLGGFDETLQLGEDVDLLRRAAHQMRGSPGRRVVHVDAAEIRTSPRRLRRNHHLGLLQMFGRWLLAFVGVGRQRPY